MINVCIMKNRLTYLAMCLMVGNNANKINNVQSYSMGLIVPVCYTQDPLLMFRRIFVNAYINPR